MAIAQINGTTLFHEETGRGEPLVLVHGAWVDHTSWDAVVPRLAESFRVVTYDLRGHGSSPLDPPDAGTVHDDIADLVALVEHLELGPVNVAGISSGACITLRLTVERPELVRRAIAHEPPSDWLLAGDPEVKAILDEYLESLEMVRERLESGAHQEAAERFVDTVAIGPGRWPMLPQSVQDTFVRHAPAFLGQLKDSDALQIDLDALSSNAAPLLLSQGDQSPSIFPPIMDRLAAKVTSAERRTFRNAGHVPHSTNPDDYAATVARFIQE